MATPLAVLDRIQLRAKAKSLSIEIQSGEIIAIMGPAGGGKSHLLEVIAGAAKPADGKFTSEVPIHFCGDPIFPRRATPLSLARSAQSTKDNQRTIIVLNALGLTDVREQPVVRLSQSQMIACTLIEGLIPESGITLIDGLLDLLDPWILDRTLRVMLDDLELGKSYLFATHQPPLAERADQLILVKEQSMVFAGSIPDLIARTKPAEFIIECDDNSTVAALVEPFAISIKKSPGRIVFTTHRGQSLAAKLLTHGYGPIRTITVNQPTLADALKTLV